MTDGMGHGSKVEGGGEFKLEVKKLLTLMSREKKGVP